MAPRANRWHFREGANVRTIRFGFTVATAFAIAALLGSCAGAATGNTGAATHKAAATPTVVGLVPKVDDCWQQDDYATAKSWAWWAGSDPVRCSTAHNSVTVLVETLDKGLKYPASLTAESNAAELGADPAWDAAMTAAENKYTAQVARTSYTRATLFYYVPTPKQWAAGQRWLRLDLLLHDYGLVSADNMTPLPSRSVMEDKLKHDGYDLCLNTANPAPQVGPLADKQAVSAPCAAPWPQWVLMPRAAFDGADGAFPGVDAVAKDVRTGCDSIQSTLRTKYGVAYSPTQEEWNHGDHQGTCWVSPPDKQ